jgi:hypothetical protein
MGIKKKLKISITATIDPALSESPLDVELILRSVQNIITDTNEFYHRSDVFITEMLNESIAIARANGTLSAPPKHVPEGKNLIMMSAINLADSSAYIAYDGVTKDVEDSY